MKMRFGQLELRKAKTRTKKPREYWEIVYWTESKSCFAIAIFNEEGNLEFVDTRPIQSYCDWNMFKKIINLAVTIQELEEDAE